jgi:CDGSH-type Zn-finger protein
MARVIRHDLHTPYRILPSSHAQWICSCGLSQNKPFCDGSHTQVRSEDPNRLYIYSEQTQQVIKSVHFTDSLFSSLFSAQKKQDSPITDAPKYLRKIRSSDPDFKMILDLRKSVNSKADPEDEFDQSADHYLIANHEMAIAAMRVNQARKGSLDCEKYYPDKFLSDYRYMIGSASRLVKAKPNRGAPKEIFDFVRAVWRDQFLDGMRIDLINVHIPVIPLYLRIGYSVISRSQFIHPRLDTDSLAMCLIADAKGSSKMSGSFGDYYDPVLINNIKRNLPVCKCKFEDYFDGEEYCKCPR